MIHKQIRTIVRRKWWLSILSLSVLCTLSACSCIRGWDTTDVASQNGVGFIEPDSIARETLGDSVISTLTHPKRIVLYTLSPLTRPGDKDYTIGNYMVTNIDTVVPLDYYTVLMFLLADSNNYDRGDNVKAVGFMPSNALTVVSETDTVSLLFSPVSTEIGIVHKGVVTKIFRYNNQRLFLLFFNRMLNNDIYNKMLNAIQQ